MAEYKYKNSEMKVYFPYSSYKEKQTKIRLIRQFLF